ncbi:hypothetical protein HOA56_00615 [archaeon]|jgi:hypothetical protein|nr:hypothetical protein [Candidatus Woesearchaeota archaeon]MBT6820904.1 hypothetical protein [archaeon]
MGEEVLFQEEGVSKWKIYLGIFIIVVLLVAGIIFLILKFSSNDLPPLGATEQEHLSSLSSEDLDELENPVLPLSDEEVSPPLPQDLPLDAEGEFEE